MAENTDEWSAHGRTNMFGETVRLIEMQSEAVRPVQFTVRFRLVR